MDHSEIEEITFIDEQLGLEDIEKQLAAQPFDFIIGPLLKDNIGKVSSSSAIQSTPTLHLNNSDTENLNPEQYFFALNPEHEVEQAMVHFLAQQYQKPMLLAPDTLSGLRLVNHFKNQWQKFSLIEPEVGLYTDSKDMAKVVANLLEVDASKSRIKTVKSLFRKEVESETRSRMDIDVIYILGDAIETRLLKPYLDVNVSTFADRIPLYASSRSYSKRMDHTDKGDLEGLYFTEQPWMLNKSVDSFNLRTQYNLLWPEQADIEQRLFAMAFDAVQLIPELKQLSKIPGKAYSGLTGRLSIKDNNTVERRLEWAQYKQKQIQLVQLNEQQPTPLFMQNQNRFQDNLRD
jgi:outer membrane PBP1 activator LpoA protein